MQISYYTDILQIFPSNSSSQNADVPRGWRVWYSSPFLFIYWWEFLQFPLIWNILFLYCLFIQLANGCYKRPRPPLPPPFFLRPVHTFRCSQYDSWDQSPKTFVVPAGDFCSSLLIPPAKPQCARNKNTDAPRLSIFDGEGTDCTIEMYNSPGTQFNSLQYWNNPKYVQFKLFYACISVNQVSFHFKYTVELPLRWPCKCQLLELNHIRQWEKRNMACLHHSWFHWKSQR